MKNHWDNFWQTGTISSIPFSNNNDYSKLIANYWMSFFDALKENTKVLDVATGNFIVPVFALISSKNTSKKLKVFATDLAMIDVEPVIQKNSHLTEHLKKIQYSSGVNTESLPFDDGSIGCITSMYGFEYSSIKNNLVEFERVLISKGVIKLLCHSEDSSLLIKNKLTKACISDILTSSKTLKTLENLSLLMGSIRTTKDLQSLKFNTKCENAREKLNNCLSHLQEKYNEALFSTELPSFISELLKGLLPSTHEERLLNIKNKRKQMKDVLERLEDLQKASLTQSDIDQIFTVAKELDIKVKKNETVTDSFGNTLGVGFELQKK